MAKKKVAKKKAPTKKCSKCGTEQHVATQNCKKCGQAFTFKAGAKKKAVAKKKLPTPKHKPTKKGPPQKECPQCGTKVHSAKRACPDCAYAFPLSKKVADWKRVEEKEQGKAKKKVAQKPGVTDQQTQLLSAADLLDKFGGDLEAARESLVTVALIRESPATRKIRENAEKP